MLKGKCQKPRRVTLHCGLVGDWVTDSQVRVTIRRLLLHYIFFIASRTLRIRVKASATYSSFYLLPFLSDLPRSVTVRRHHSLLRPLPSAHFLHPFCNLQWHLRLTEKPRYVCRSNFYKGNATALNYALDNRLFPLTRLYLHVHLSSWKIDRRTTKYRLPTKDRPGTSWF